MGFMDKLKDAGKGALKGAMALASTTYGKVLSGKYEGYKIAGLGEEGDSLTFVKGTSIEDPILIKDVVQTFSVVDEDDEKDMYGFDLIFQDGETSLVFINNMAPDEQKRKQNRLNSAKLMIALAFHVPEDPNNETKHWVNKMMRKAGASEVYRKKE